MIPLFLKGKMDNIDINKFIVDSYKNMIFNNSTLKEIVECIENEDRIPIVLSSTLGKDRATVYSAIILSILSIPRKVIIKDYISSNFYRKEFNENIMKVFVNKGKNKRKLDILEYIQD